MENVNIDIFLAYLSPFLEVRDLGTLACTSRALRKLADDNHVWCARYHAARKRTFRIVPTSVHVGPKIYYACTKGITYEKWQHQGMPCTRVTHYAKETLQEYGHTVKFQFFKRMYAKRQLTRINREAMMNTFYIRRHWAGIRLGDPSSPEFIEHWRVLQQRVDKSMHYIILAHHYTPILTLPTTMPTYLNK